VIGALAGLGENQPISATFKQFCTEPRLKCTQLRRYRGLRDHQEVGRTGDAPLVNDKPKYLESA
jgi:hypothetical protein